MRRPQQAFEEDAVKPTRSDTPVHPRMCAPNCRLLLQNSAACRAYAAGGRTARPCATVVRSRAVRHKTTMTRLIPFTIPNMTGRHEKTSLRPAATEPKWKALLRAVCCCFCPHVADWRKSHEPLDVCARTFVYNWPGSGLRCSTSFWCVLRDRHGHTHGGNHVGRVSCVSEPAEFSIWCGMVAFASQSQVTVTDTTYMYMIAVLCIMQLYSRRHSDVQAQAWRTYAPGSGDGVKGTTPTSSNITNVRYLL
ncbi:unnamed protein product [Sphagnum balticum]